MDKRTIKTVLVTLAIVALVVGALQFVGYVKRAVAPGQQAAQYLDTLVRLGYLPSGAQVDQAVAKARANTQPLTPEQLGGEYVDKVPDPKAEQPKAKK